MIKTKINHRIDFQSYLQQRQLKNIDYIFDLD